MLQNHQIKIYSAAKTWHAEEFRKMRDIHGFNIVARWIDEQDVLTSPTDTFPEEILFDEEYKQRIWDQGCKQDCESCDMGILYCTPKDNGMLSGALVELGHITAFNKPMYIIGRCSCVMPIRHSDRAWKSQNCVHTFHDIRDMLEGFEAAVSHYIENYYAQWIKNNTNKNQDKLSTTI